MGSDDERLAAIRDDAEWLAQFRESYVEYWTTADMHRVLRMLDAAVAREAGVLHAHNVAMTRIEELEAELEGTGRQCARNADIANNMRLERDAASARADRLQWFLDDSTVRLNRLRAALEAICATDEREYVAHGPRIFAAAVRRARDALKGDNDVGR